ncbi:MAG: polyprenyl diphosphate synthase [Candidatus Marsarchaeota archaeon]|nr:polyprenyl diphosphate synthase [Candidatus Marsarchaeota archaeon]
MASRHLPSTLALIPDGNRRWAQHNKLSVLKGYKHGVSKFIDFSEWCVNEGIHNITVWAFSSENINRPKREVNALFGIYERAANDKKLMERIHENHMRINIISNPAVMPKKLVSILNKIEEETAHYNTNVVNMLLGYGGRADIEFAIQKMKRLRRFSVSEFSRNLMSKAIPNIDMIIRTSGEMRLSGFMPWQSAYSELYFSNKLWPDFSKKDFDMALAEYSRRERRKGK